MNTRIFSAVIAFVVLVATLGAFSSVAGAKPHGGHGPRAQHHEVYDGKWKHSVSKRNKRWASRTSACESGRNPNALGAGGLYRGAFQFSRSTWRMSPSSPGGDPIAYSYRTQAFVAVRLKMAVGTGPWPSCG
jgi:hypothetical protein